ncbi:MAG: transporter substrate-binding domain-containing protein [Burkholderiales bacterium]|nr:transporter substrate-binding domain-containing protein [Burkholderiales bacterium]
MAWRWLHRGVLLVLLCCAARVMPAPATESAAPHYRFRLPPGRTTVLPGRDLLDAAERDFIAGLPEVRVGLNLPDNRPYEVIGPDGEITGIQIEILTHIAQALGLRLKPVVLPSFPQALAAVRDRQVDIMATVGFEPSREAYMAFTLGTAPNPGAIIGRAADTRFASHPSLNGQRVAIEKDYVTQYYARRLYPEVLVTDQPDTAHALRAVALGEEDYYFGSLLMAMDRIQRDAVAGLEVKKSLIYATGQMHFGVRNDWPLLATALSKGVAALRAAPLPQLNAALQSLGPQGLTLPQALKLARAEQQQLAGRSVLRVGAVRGLTLLNEALPKGGHSGIAADYTSQVVARLGVAVDVLPFDSVAEMLDALREGSIHVVPFLTRTAAREREFAFSQPYLEMPYLIVARTDAPLYWGLDSLRGKRLALALQHPLRELLAQHYPDIRVVDARNGEDAMDRVARGEADAAVEVKLFANMRINSDAGGRLRAVAPVEQLPAQFHFAIAQGAAELAPLINRALADIAPEERDRMLRRWVAIDLQPAFPWRRYLPMVATVLAALALLAVASVWWMRRLSREVTVRRGREEQLLNAMQAQNLFVASASHELRSPLQAVTLALQHLGDSALDKPQQRLWQVASDSSASLVQLIDDVLDLARLEARRLVLHPVPLDLRALLSQLVDNHRLSADARGLQLVLDWDERIPRGLQVDALRLRQLLVNLISNAIKYTHAGTVTVQARALGAAGDQTLQIVVRDTGIGIAPERQHALFEPFETLHHPAHAPAEGSTGLGLAICKRLVDAMGGRITLDSAPGRGTEVQVSLPMPPQAELPPPPAPVPTTADPTRVLLVDDDDVSRVLMADVLRGEGHAVTEAATVAQALAAWHEARPDLVLSDRHLPDGDGLQLLQQLAGLAQAAGRAVRLVLCSGSEPEAAGSLGPVHAVLRKPVPMGQLRAQAAAHRGTA